jgi:flagellar secretion chaperone FliS
MSGNPYQSYLESEVLSADPIQLVQLLYRGAIEGIEQARQHVRSGDIAARGRAITKAGNIVAELIGAVDREKGGELARHLLELYDYVQRRLNQGHFEQSEAPLEEAGRLMATLLEGWQACASTAGPAEPRPAPRFDMYSDAEPQSLLAISG